MPGVVVGHQRLLQPVDVELGEPVHRDDCLVEPVAVVRIDEELHVVADRLANDDALVSALTEMFATDTADEWERLLLGAGVGAARADRGSFASFQQAEIASGRHALARRVSSPGRGEHWRASAVVDMRGVDELGGACVAGQHSRAILAELGYTPAQIESLIERGIVGEAGER